jgi:MFS family permease
VSDVNGRRTAYTCTLIVSVGACIGLALTKNYATLIILRCLQSAGSASTVAIGSGVIGDITTRAERGGYMGFFQGGMLVPIAVGPVIGGALAGTLGWRSIFWFLTVYSVFLFLLLFLLLPETLRSIVANGGLRPSGILARYPLNLYQRFTKVQWDPEAASRQLTAKKRIDMLGPFRILTTKHATPIIMFFAVYFTVWQMTLTSMSTLFKTHYGLSEMQTGLTFIANGVGSIVGTMITGKILDKDYRRIQAKHQARSRPNLHEAHNHSQPLTITEDHDFPLEKARLRLIPIILVSQCMSVLLFGWTIRYSVHIAVPIVSTFLTGWTSVSTQSIVTTYVVDVFPDQSAAATASLNLARCLFAAGGTSFVIPLVDRVGAGVAFTICAAVQLVAGIGLVLQWRYAGAWRKKASEGEADR